MTYRPRVLDVPNGGTGLATLTNHGVLVGAAAGNVTPLAAGTAGQVLQSGGASADPAYSTATFPATATATGTLLRADGTNWAATTSTYPATNAVSTLLYASSANVMGALATANSAILATDSSGVPSITTASGNWLNTSRCAFSAYLSASTSNDKTGDGTTYTLICDTELFDQGSNYDNSTGTFTAPVAGKYYITGTVATNNQTATNDSYPDINCSTAGVFRGSRVLAGQTNVGYVVSVFVNLALNETVTLRFAANSGAKTVGIAGHATIKLSYFSGYLVC